MDIIQKIEELLRQREEIPPLQKFVPKKRAGEKPTADLDITHFGKVLAGADELGPAAEPEGPGPESSVSSEEESIMLGVRELTLDDVSSSEPQPADSAPATPASNQPPPSTTSHSISQPPTKEREILVVTALLRKGLHEQAIEVIRRMRGAGQG